MLRTPPSATSDNGSRCLTLILYSNLSAEDVIDIKNVLAIKNLFGIKTYDWEFFPAPHCSSRYGARISGRANGYEVRPDMKREMRDIEGLLDYRHLVLRTQIDNGRDGDDSPILKRILKKSYVMPELASFEKRSEHLVPQILITSDGQIQSTRRLSRRDWQSEHDFGLDVFTANMLVAHGELDLQMLDPDERWWD